MTGVLAITTERQKARIKAFTKEGLSVSVIAERLGLSKLRIYECQVREGLREPKKRDRKKIDGNAS